MSLTHGRLTARRFLVSEETPLPALRDTVYREATERLHEFGFRPIPPRSLLEEFAGWVRPDDVLSTDFTEDVNAWQVGNYLFFGLRIDSKTVPSKRLDALVKANIKKWCLENAATRAPRAVREQFREMNRESLLMEAVPTMQVVQVAYDFVAGVVVIDAASDRIGDVFRKRFYRTFGLKLEVDGISRWVDSQTSDPPVSVNQASAFRLWLWYMTEERGSVLPGFRQPQHMVTLVNRLILSWDDQRVEVVATDPARVIEARSALARNFEPTELTVFLDLEDGMAYAATLRGENPDLASVGLAGGDEDEGGQAAALLVRMANFEDLVAILQDLCAAWIHNPAKDDVALWRRSPPDLNHLLASVTDENRHAEGGDDDE